MKNSFKTNCSNLIQNTRIDGAGLGMSIVQELVKKMDGTIKVESKIDEGTQFIVQLPLEIDLTC